MVIMIYIHDDNLIQTIKINNIIIKNMSVDFYLKGLYYILYHKNSHFVYALRY